MEMLYKLLGIALAFVPFAFILWYVITQTIKKELNEIKEKLDKLIDQKSKPKE